MTLFVTLGDVIWLVALALALFVAGASWAVASIKQSLCKHDGGVSETRACDAICRKCGKNLGFIGRWK